MRLRLYIILQIFTFYNKIKKRKAITTNGTKSPKKITSHDSRGVHTPQYYYRTPLRSVLYINSSESNTSQIYESSTSYTTVSRQLNHQNNTHNDTLSAKLKNTKEYITKYSQTVGCKQSRFNAVCQSLRQLDFFRIAANSPPPRTPVGLSSTLRRPLRRSLRQTRLASRARRHTSWLQAVFDFCSPCFRAI